jgi:hypothetical protein
MPDGSHYRTLDPDKLVLVLDQLERRIVERFPAAGLARVCAELAQIARETRARVVKIEARNMPLRAAMFLLVAALAALLVKVGWLIDFTRTSADNVYSVLQGIEAALNIVVLMAAALWSLVTLEDRLKRRRAIAALHELRSIVHVIDMHQLTKDPQGIAGRPENHTASSPNRTLTPFELTRYLDYCSEMLSLAAKVAAIYAQSLPDQVVAETANELEQVATNLSQKIWQKITIVQAISASDADRPQPDAMVPGPAGQPHVAPLPAPIATRSAP